MRKDLIPVSINGIEFDALIGEDRVLPAESPDYPTEKGFVVSDAIIHKPETLDMTLYLSNTPVTWKRRFGANPNRVQETIKKLEELYYSKTLVKIITADKTYTDMSIVSITLSKNVDTGYAREIPISFKKIRVAESKTTTIPDSYGKSGATGTNAGTANVKAGSSGTSESDAKKEEGKGSLLHNLNNKYGFAEKIGLL